MQWAARELREPRTCPSLPTMQLREKRRQRCCPSKCSPWPPLPLAAVGSPSSLRCPTISSVTAARNKGVGHRRAGETKSNHQDCCGSRMKDAHRAAQAEARRAGVGRSLCRQQAGVQVVGPHPSWARGGRWFRSRTARGEKSKGAGSGAHRGARVRLVHCSGRVWCRQWGGACTGVEARAHEAGHRQGRQGRRQGCPPTACTRPEACRPAPRLLPHTPAHRGDGGQAGGQAGRGGCGEQAGTMSQ